jgi:hypothetical protein
MDCFICGGDHFARECCVSKGGQGKGKRFRRDRGGKNRGPANWVQSDNDGFCFNCGGDHLARYCTNRGDGEGGNIKCKTGGGKSKGACFRCGGDHYASKCPNGSGGSGGRDYGGVCGKFGGGSGGGKEKGKRRDRGKKNRGNRGGKKNRGKEKGSPKGGGSGGGYGGGGYGGCQCSLFRGCTNSPAAGSTLVPRAIIIRCVVPRAPVPSASPASGSSHVPASTSESSRVPPSIISLCTVSQHPSSPPRTLTGFRTGVFYCRVFGFFYYPYLKNI